MPLSGTGKDLGDKIAALIITPDADPQVKADLIKLWEDIGSVIVDHLVSNIKTTINAGIPVQTTGSAAAQAGVTTAPGNGGIL